MKMTKKQYIGYWVKAAKHDFKTIHHLFEKGDYIWALFIPISKKIVEFKKWILKKIEE